MIISSAMRPDVNFLLNHPAHCIALGFGSGLSPRAPGTLATLLAWLIYPLLKTPVSDFVFFAFLLSLFFAGVIACDRTGRALGASDHGAMVWDAMVATWLVLLLTPAAFFWQAIAVTLFRVFNTVKPQPIRWIGTHLSGGFGVMLDDMLAAAYTILTLAILVRIFGMTPWMMN